MRQLPCPTGFVVARVRVWEPSTYGRRQCVCVSSSPSRSNHSTKRHGTRRRGARGGSFGTFSLTSSRTRERTYASLTLDLIRGGFGPDRTMGKAAKRLRSTSVPELAERLRMAAERHFHLPGSTEAMGLADVLVHGADAFRPVGLGVDAPPSDAGPALDALWKSGRVVVHAVPHRGRRLVATDLDWSRGNGPEVRGRAIDLLLFVANRRQVLPDLEGPGLNDL